MRQLPKIFFEDSHIIVIDKPAGLPSVSLKQGSEVSLASWILENYPNQSALPNGELEAGLIHRLDNDTSGIIIAAKDEDVYFKLKCQFEEFDVKKEYKALVIGATEHIREIATPIAHHPTKKKKMFVCSSQDEAQKFNARSACTRFCVGERYVGYSLLNVEIVTGVRHQIRVHLASIGHPIVGDRLYQGPKQRPLDNLKLDRYFLHASRLILNHPINGKQIVFQSDLPEDLKNVLKRLRHVG